MVLAGGVAAEQHRRIAVAADEHVYASIVVEVPHREPARGKHLVEHRPGLPADVAEPSSVVAEEEQRLLVFHLRRPHPDHIVWVTVGQQQVDVPVVVEVEELQAPAAEETRGVGDAVLVGDVGEDLAVAVPVQGEPLVVDVGDEEILPAVGVEIRRIDAHA